MCVCAWVKFRKHFFASTAFAARLKYQNYRARESILNTFEIITVTKATKFTKCVKKSLENDDANRKEMLRQW